MHLSRPLDSLQLEGPGCENPALLAFFGGWEGRRGGFNNICLQKTQIPEKIFAHFQLANSFWSQQFRNRLVEVKVVQIF